MTGLAFLMQKHDLDNKTHAYRVSRKVGVYTHFIDPTFFEYSLLQSPKVIPSFNVDYVVRQCLPRPLSQILFETGQVETFEQQNGANQWPLNVQNNFQMQVPL